MKTSKYIIVFAGFILFYAFVSYIISWVILWAPFQLIFWFARMFSESVAQIIVYINLTFDFIFIMPMFILIPILAHRTSRNLIFQKFSIDKSVVDAFRSVGSVFARLLRLKDKTLNQMNMEKP